MQMAWFVVAVMVGVVAAAGVAYFRIAQRRIPPDAPGVWPVIVRPLIGSGERRTLAALCQAMPEQQISPKIAVARFTNPNNTPDAKQWYKRLQGIYCTFTVSSADGKVLGCVDVENDSGPSEASLTMKRTLFSQLNMTYLLVDPKDLPGSAELRAAFLGEPPLKISEHLQAPDAAESTRSALDAIFEEKRQSRPGALEAFPNESNRRARHAEHQLRGRVS